MSIYEPLLKVSYLGNFRYRLVRYYLVNIPYPMLGKTNHPMIYRDLFPTKCLPNPWKYLCIPLYLSHYIRTKNLKVSGFCILSPSSPYIFPLNKSPFPDDKISMVVSATDNQGTYINIYIWPIYGLCKGIFPQHMALYGTVPLF